MQLFLKTIVAEDVFYSFNDGRGNPDFYLKFTGPFEKTVELPDGYYSVTVTSDTMAAGFVISSDTAAIHCSNTPTSAWVTELKANVESAPFWTQVDVDTMESGFWWFIVFALFALILWAVRQMKSINFNQP